MKLYFAIATFFSLSFLNAQTKDDLIAKQNNKKELIEITKKEVVDLQKQIDSFSSWKYSALGTLGGSIQGYKNWYANVVPNQFIANIDFILNGSAFLMKEKYFWNNDIHLNLSWDVYDNTDTSTDNDRLSLETEMFTISSLFGYKINEKFAYSAYTEYFTRYIRSFNNPGYLDLGAGITWTPKKEWQLFINPLNYNFVFSHGDNIYESSPGAKIRVYYDTNISKVSIKSKLSIFQSYKSIHYSNFIWINTVGYKFWRNFGIGIDFSLRRNMQEALNYELKTNPDASFDSVKNKIQLHWTFGLHYSLK